ncbi:MAG: acyl carrier protein [Gammaproteobacteria bacterium]|nr:acyl carrier protein [Gammaproteobacteria bacterium]
MNTQEAISWIANLFNVDEKDIRVDLPRESLDYWDSMGMLLLMGELDDLFDFTLSKDQLNNISTINDLLDILKEKKFIVDK